MGQNDTIKPTYGQAIKNLYTELDKKGIDPEGLCRNGYDLEVASNFSNFVSVAQGQEHEPLDAKGEQLFDECEKAIKELEERQLESKSIEELL